MLTTHAWITTAACRSLSPSAADALFFAGQDQPEERARALALCRSCTSRLACRAEADRLEGDRSRSHLHGIRGGELPPERWHRRNPAQAVAS